MQKNMSGSLNGVIDEMLSGSVAGNIQFDSTGGGSTVTITPTLESGTKIADFTIDDTDGSLYAPTPEPPIEYTAGANISISEENVISATDTTYTAGDNITIENGVISASSSSAINYSTNEQEIGTWIDGSPLYQRTWFFSSPISINQNSWGDSTILISETNINFIVECQSMSSNGYNQPIGATTDGGTTTYVRIFNPRTNSGISISYLTLKYTKTSSQ